MSISAGFIIFEQHCHGIQFRASNGDYRKRTGIVAEANISGTSAEMQIRQDYARKTGKSYGTKLSNDEKREIAFIEFREGDDYDDYFKPPTLMLANGPASIAATLETFIIIGILPVGLIQSNEQINSDAVVADQVLEASDSSKNKKHGDEEALSKAEKQIAELEAQLDGANKKENKEKNRKC